MLHNPGLMHPEPLPLHQSTAGDTQTQFCLSLCGISGSWCTQGLFESCGHLCQFDSKHEFMPPTIFLLLSIYPPEMLGGLKQTLCAPGPRDPTENEPELCLSVSCRGDSGSVVDSCRGRGSGCSRLGYGISR